MTLAVVRIRGTVNVTGDIRDTLRMLRLNRANHCVLLPETPVYKGMLNKVKDYVTWGELSVEILIRLLHHHARIDKQQLNDAMIKKSTKYKSLMSYAKALVEGKEVFSYLKGVNPVLRLHPPVKGYRSVKRNFSDGGALGYRGVEINRLLERMIFIKGLKKEAKEAPKKKEIKEKPEKKGEAPKKEAKEGDERKKVVRKKRVKKRKEPKGKVKSSGVKD